MKISMHDASRSENIRSTSKCCHTKFHIILSNRLALLCLQIHFWSLCTYARLWKSACTMQVDRKTLAVLQRILILNFTLFRTVDKHYFACTFIFGSVHVCTTMKISMHNASRSENICSTSKNSHTKFHIIPYSRLALLCLQIHFRGLCTYARLWKSACTMQVDRKTLAVHQSIVILNFTSFRTVD